MVAALRRTINTDMLKNYLAIWRLTEIRPKCCICPTEMAEG
ncbi:hypothetical protein HMPREF3226_02500 [Prevotella corporis]|uniref:Uncharacterized protein n=1 Tax=Prevotella corporis TaxID=28128 RepID=A0A133PVU1_9BACT|nr:hypothetical protein HMPREF3226_02500 [Prevotella corporis]